MANDRNAHGHRHEGCDRQAEDPIGALTTLSRRQLIKAVIASGAVASGAGFLLRGSVSSAQAAGTAERLLTLTVNGQKRRVDVLPQETLVQTLRNKLGLTGTKIGCDRGECGACTVLIDDVPSYACSTLTHRLRGRKITTIEGLEGPHGELHKVQKAFIAALAPQCGFCTPGQVMAAVALLRVKPNPSVEEVRQAISGNLCRCGAYDNYLQGVLAAAAEV
jgi:aerobic-type carbon monoxide dehydrogenase small subunit (CoxS/CutS family)